MRHWSQLATRNWRARKVLAGGAVLAVALGTATVVWVMCCHESVRRSALQWSNAYVGHAHIAVTSMFGKLDQIPERLARQLTTLENVAVANPHLLLRRSCQLVPKSEWERQTDAIGWSSSLPDADFQGLDLETDLKLREYPITAGRMLTESDDRACVTEASFAAAYHVGLGDYLLIWDESRDRPEALKIVGLYERPRVGKIQKPVTLLKLNVLQAVTQKYALVSGVDIALTKDDPDSIKKAESQIRQLARKIAPNSQVRSAEDRVKQVRKALDNQRLVLVMLGCVGVLTALFIILSTLSMGMVERVRQLGLLRCIGMTRWQLACLVLWEVLPLGVAGIVLGILGGFGLTALSVRLVPEYVGSFVVSSFGIVLAVGSGLLTTIIAALLPALAVLRVSPLEAAHPSAAVPRLRYLILVTGLGALILAMQYVWAAERILRDVNFVQMAAVGVVLLYFGYAFLAPPAVRLIGSWSVVIAALFLRMRTRLLQDQVGYAVWRSAGICCGLMVGLSLVVGMIVVNESVAAGWQFPKQFPSAFAWSYGQLSPDTSERVGRTRGVGRYTVANSINVVVEERNPLLEKMLLSVTWFMGVEPDSFLDLVKLEFLEGDEETTRDLLKRGGYVVIADDFARSRNKHVGDDVKIYVERIRGWRESYFKVAAVVRSPALDIAAAYFQLSSEYSVAASGSVMGSNEDLKRMFGINGANLVLLDFDLPPQPVPADWPPQAAAAHDQEIPARYYDESIPLERRWQRWREQQVLYDLRESLDDPGARVGSVADLKDEIDHQLKTITGLLTAIPGVALLVAAVGVANLMTANVTARAKQIAILRAVGATRGLILRMVVGEALVLGLLGSALGLVLGMHLAENITRFIDRMWGFRVALELPWGYIGLSAALTIGLCVFAGVIPARHAARTNITDALHVA